MKIAVFSDVHGNVPALEAVLGDIEAWGPDVTLVNGDLINRGPDSLGVLRLMQHRMPQAYCVQGNHEGFALRQVGRERDPEDPAFDLRRFSVWTAAQMGPELEQVRAWPHHLDLEDPDGGSVHVTHGSVLGNREGILPETGDEELRAKLGDPRELFIAAHTHRPLVRHFDGTLVVNIGSVGAPFDRDPRAAYGRLTFHSGRWRADIRRVPFDRQATERSFVDSGFLDGGGPLARLMLTELRHCRGHMGHFMRRYYQPILDGAITVRRAVDCYLAEL